MTVRRQYLERICIGAYTHTTYFCERSVDARFPRVGEELQRLLASKTQDEDRSEEWKSKQIEEMKKLGVPLSACVPPAEQRESAWYPVLQEREQRVLGHAFLTKENLVSADVKPSCVQKPAILLHQSETGNSGRRGQAQ